MTLDECRKAIDEIDSEMLELLNRRAALSREIGLIKTFAGLPIIDLQREADVLGRIARESRGDISRDCLARIYGEVLGESRRIQITIAAEATAAGEIA